MGRTAGAAIGSAEARQGRFALDQRTHPPVCLAFADFWPTRRYQHRPQGRGRGGGGEIVDLPAQGLVTGEMPGHPLAQPAPGAARIEIPPLGKAQAPNAPTRIVTGAFNWSSST